MISVSGKNWTQQKINKNLVEKAQQDYGLGYILSHLIISRNYDASEIFGINNSQKLTNIFLDDQDYQRPGKFRGGRGVKAAYQDAKYDPNDPPKGLFGTAKDVVDKHTLTARKA